MSRRSAEGRSRGRGFPVVFRPPALACWASCSRRGLPPSSRSAYQVGAKASTRTPTGFPRSAHPSHGRIGCPLYPETTRCSADQSDPSGRRVPPLPGARSYRPGPPKLSITGRRQGFTRVHPPGLPPGPVIPGWNRDSLGRTPRAPYPADQGACNARRGGSRASSTRPELPYDRHRRTSYPTAHSLCATSCRTIGVDMTRYPSAAHLVSWAKFCPQDPPVGR